MPSVTCGGTYRGAIWKHFLPSTWPKVVKGEELIFFGIIITIIIIVVEACQEKALFSALKGRCLGPALLSVASALVALDTSCRSLLKAPLPRTDCHTHLKCPSSSL